MTGANFEGHVGGVLNLKEVFRNLAVNRQSGLLSISEGDRSKSIYFAEGAVTILSSSRRQRLGQMLVATGKITEDDLDLAVKLQQQNSQLLGEILVEEGFCDEEDIERLVRVQVEGEIYDCFLWPDAYYKFDAQGAPPVPTEGKSTMKARLDVDDLLTKVVSRIDDWDKNIRPKVQSLQEIFVLTDRPYEGLNLPDSILSNMDFINGETTVAQFSEEVNLSEFETCKHLATLVKMGIIQRMTVDQIAQKAAIAHASNDFGKASALYDRLNDLYPNQLKIEIPLADSLRQTGQGFKALKIFDSIATKLEAQLEVNANGDLTALKNCYSAVLEIAPEREDCAQRLAELNRIERLREKRKKRWIPVAILGGVFAFLGILWLGLVSAVNNKQAQDQKIKAELKKAIDAFEELKKTDKWQEIHAAGIDLIKRFKKRDEIKGLRVPMTIKSQPVGFKVIVNGEERGQTSAAKPVLVAFYDPLKGAPSVQLKPTRPEGNDTVVFDNNRAQAAAQFIQYDIPIEDKADWKFIGEAQADREIGYIEALKTYLFASRDGRLYALDKDGRPSYRSVDLGEFGDVFSSVETFEQEAYVGLSAGGVAVVKYPEAELLKPRYIASGSVHGKPVVTKERVAFATYDGHIHVYKKEGESLSELVTPSIIEHSPLLWEDEKSAFFAGTDLKLRQIKLDDGTELKSFNLPNNPISGPIQCGNSVGILTEGGVAVISSSLDFSLGTRRFSCEGDAPYTMASDGKHVFLASQTKLRAVVLDTGEDAWKQSFSEHLQGPPRLGLIKNNLLFSSGTTRTFGLDTDTGVIVWVMRLETNHISSPISTFGDHFLAGLRGPTIIKASPFYR